MNNDGPVPSLLLRRLHRAEQSEEGGWVTRNATGGPVEELEVINVAGPPGLQRIRRVLSISNFSCSLTSTTALHTVLRTWLLIIFSDERSWSSYQFPLAIWECVYGRLWVNLAYNSDIRFYRNYVLCKFQRPVNWTEFPLNVYKKHMGESWEGSRRSLCTCTENGVMKSSIHIALSNYV